MCWSDTHKSDVVVLKDVAWVHILLVSPNKIVELVIYDEAVCSSTHYIHHLRRVFIVFGPCPLILGAVLDGVAKQKVKEDIDGDDSDSEYAHYPVEDAHVNLHELALYEAWIFVHLAVLQELLN